VLVNLHLSVKISTLLVTVVMIGTVSVSFLWHVDWAHWYCCMSDFI